MKYTFSSIYHLYKVYFKCTEFLQGISLVCLVPVSQYNSHKQCVFFYKWTRSFRRETVVAVNIYQPISLLVQVHVTFLSRCIHYYKRGNKKNYNIESFTLNEQKLLFIWLHIKWLCPLFIFIILKQVNDGMTQLLDYSLLLIAFITTYCSSGHPKSYVFPMQGCVWLCRAIYVWLCRAMYGYVGLCMAVYGYVGLCMVMYGYVGLCRAMYGYVGLCRAM